MFIFSPALPFINLRARLACCRVHFGLEMLSQ